MASMFAKMDTSLTIYPTRIMCLTLQTSKALSLTIKRLITIIKMFLGKGIKYVMTGNFQSDRLEGEFGIYRQLDGGNYFYVSNQLDDCFNEASDLNETEISTLYYISGYICHKENLQSAPLPSLELPASEFTNNVSHGKLRHPPMELYDLSLYLFSYYKSLDDKTCIKKVMMAFQHIYEASQCDFQNITSILRRFLNTILQRICHSRNRGYIMCEKEQELRCKTSKVTMCEKEQELRCKTSKVTMCEKEQELRCKTSKVTMCEKEQELRCKTSKVTMCEKEQELRCKTSKVTMCEKEQELRCKTSKVTMCEKEQELRCKTSKVTMCEKEQETQM